MENKTPERKRRPRPEGEVASKGAPSREEALRKRRPRPEGEEAPRKRRPRPEGEVASKNVPSTEAPRKRRPRPEIEVPGEQTTRRPVRLDQEDMEMRSTNSAKSQGRKSSGRKSKRELEKERKAKEKQLLYKKIGIGLAGLQILASIVFTIALVKLNMLPFGYMALLVIMLMALDALVMFGQIKSKKKALAGKILAGFMAIVLFMGSFYIFEASSVVNKISGGSNIQIDGMAVAVLADDTAESIEDAAGYNFGVQYSMKGSEITSTIEEIETELGTSITTTETDSLSAQITALYEGEVDAIIFNSAYEGVFEEVYEDYYTAVKVIYTWDLETEVEIVVSEVEVKDEAFVVYISGIDTYGSISSTSRSDVNILAVVNPTTKQILLVTTPRDSYVVLPGVSGDTKDKLTHAGIYGVQASMDAMSAIYDDIDIDFYARVNFTSFEMIVDALGGIDVYSSQTFTSTYDGTTIYVTEGTNTFTGEQALVFARDRLNVSGGDFQRGINQEELIKGMITKLISPSIITGATDILAAVADNVDTNMSTSQIQDLIKDQISSMSSWDIKMVDAEGTTGSSYCYSLGANASVVYLDDESVAEILVDINTVLDGGILEGADTIG